MENPTSNDTRMLNYWEERFEDKLFVAEIRKLSSINLFNNLPLFIVQLFSFEFQYSMQIMQQIFDNFPTTWNIDFSIAYSHSALHVSSW